MKILVGIANYGSRNAKLLRTVIKEYQSMSYEIDIVVFSNISKELDPGIEVRVQLPSGNPLFLPFGHKRLFAERLDEYDLFIYSEDDILITEQNIQSFLQLTKVLPKGKICGFLRYELDSAGERWYPDFVGPFHWVPGSVEQIEQFTVAKYSNDHSACYVLTRDQLRSAIMSGGYLVGPHEGRYDLLVSAATDPYTQCGFDRVICISHIADVLVHHLSNRYVGRLGIDANDFNAQIGFMLSRGHDENGAQQLFITTKGVESIEWDKDYFDNNNHDLLGMVSDNIKSVLSIGCGYPSTETTLVRNNYAVTAIPLDRVVGTVVASRGIRVTEPDCERAFEDLRGSQFDCIILADILHHLENPVDILERAVTILSPEGELLISIPNVKYIKYTREYFPYPLLKRWRYSRDHLHTIGRNHIVKWCRSLGLEKIEFQYAGESRYVAQYLRPVGRTLEFARGLFTRRLLAKGKRVRG